MIFLPATSLLSPLSPFSSSHLFCKSNFLSAPLPFFSCKSVFLYRCFFFPFSLLCPLLHVCFVVFSLFRSLSLPPCKSKFHFPSLASQFSFFCLFFPFSLVCRAANLFILIFLSPCQPDLSSPSHFNSASLFSSTRQRFPIFIQFLFLFLSLHFYKSSHFPIFISVSLISSLPLPVFSLQACFPLLVRFFSHFRSPPISCTLRRTKGGVGELLATVTNYIFSE